MAMLIKPLTALPKSAEFETIKLRGYYMKPIKISNPPTTIFHKYSVFSLKAGESRLTKEPRYWKAGKEKVKAFLASVSYRKLGMMYYTTELLVFLSIMGNGILMRALRCSKHCWPHFHGWLVILRVGNPVKI